MSAPDRAALLARVRRGLDDAADALRELERLAPVGSDDGRLVASCVASCAVHVDRARADQDIAAALSRQEVDS